MNKSQFKHIQLIKLQINDFLECYSKERATFEHIEANYTIIKSHINMYNNLWTTNEIYPPWIINFTPTNAINQLTQIKDVLANYISDYNNNLELRNK